MSTATGSAHNHEAMLCNFNSWGKMLEIGKTSQLLFDAANNGSIRRVLQIPSDFGPQPGER
jgi:hypothetical protein